MSDLNESCPVCKHALVVSEDWHGGRVINCPNFESEGPHLRRVERFSKAPSSELLEKSEIDEERKIHAPIV